MAATARNRVTVVLLVAGGLAAAWFAVQGGEYGTSDLWRQQRRQMALQREIDSLKRIVDSLRSYKQRVLNDPLALERIAREEFGMLRRKELLYRIVPSDTSRP